MKTFNSVRAEPEHRKTELKRETVVQNEQLKSDHYSHLKDSMKSSQVKRPRAKFFKLQLTVFSNMRVIAQVGDITELEVDAIVNAANTRLFMGGGVAGAIKRKGGKEIEDEAVSKGPIQIGEAISTRAGRLKAQWVIHAPTMELNFVTKEEYIRKATFAALKEADKIGAKSIAFPALGTGVGGFPRDRAARIMVEEIKKYFEHGSNLDAIILTDINKDQVEFFKKAIDDIL